ncbi:unnamed protein product, partial [Amoebophrya sp. A25]|eukprot:GSA25T00023014001.1
MADDSPIPDEKTLRETIQILAEIDRLKQVQQAEGHPPSSTSEQEQHEQPPSQPSNYRL